MKHLRLVLVLVMMLIFSQGLYSWYHCNCTPWVYEEPSKTIIDNTMTTGAADFLGSYGEALLMLKELEVFPESNYNMENAMAYAETASRKLESARQKFFDAWTLCLKSTYDATNQKKLVAFNYNKIIQSERLILPIAREAASYLKKCDIAGLYKKNIERIDEIRELLKNIRSSMYSNTKPDTQSCWKLLQEYSDELLFGNYATILTTKALNN